MYQNLNFKFLFPSEMSLIFIKNIGCYHPPDKKIVINVPKLNWDRVAD